MVGASSVARPSALLSVPHVAQGLPLHTRELHEIRHLRAAKLHKELIRSEESGAGGAAVRPVDGSPTAAADVRMYMRLDMTNEQISLFVEQSVNNALQNVLQTLNFPIPNVSPCAPTAIATGPPARPRARSRARFWTSTTRRPSTGRPTPSTRTSSRLGGCV
jgi:hypothetical protein